MPLLFLHLKLFDALNESVAKLLIQILVKYALYDRLFSKKWAVHIKQLLNGAVLSSFGSYDQFLKIQPLVYVPLLTP